MNGFLCIILTAFISSLSVGFWLWGFWLWLVGLELSPLIILTVVLRVLSSLVHVPSVPAVVVLVSAIGRLVPVVATPPPPPSSLKNSWRIWSNFFLSRPAFYCLLEIVPQKLGAVGSSGHNSLHPFLNQFQSFAIGGLH